MAGIDWIPAGVKEFDDFQKIFSDGVHTNVLTWHIAPTKEATLAGLRGTYDGFYLISKNPATANPTDYDNTDEARIPYKKYIRVITKQEIKNNSYMTNAQRTSIKVPNDSGTHTDAPVEVDGPDMWFDNSHHGILFAHFKKHGVTNSEAKPAGQAEVVMFYDFYKIGDPIPPLAQCTHFTTFTESGDELPTDASHFGMMIVGYGYWKNTANKLSP